MFTEDLTLNFLNIIISKSGLNQLDWTLEKDYAYKIRRRKKAVIINHGQYPLGKSSYTEALLEKLS
jgi:hypothetical protein